MKKVDNFATTQGSMSFFFWSNGSMR